MTTTTSLQTLVDGPRNVVIKYEGTLNATDTGKVLVVDPSTLSDFDINGVKANRLRINKIVYDVEDLLTVNLFWQDATSANDKIIWNLTGRGKVDARHFGGIINNGTPAPTGAITSSFDYEGSTQVLTFTIILELVKQHT
jgi:hypothetical protein